VDIGEALKWLSAHINLESDTSARAAGRRLERTARLAELLGDPHRAFPVIHITGTNGKGTVARMITGLLEASGLSVGTYTSPHLEVINEHHPRVDGLKRVEASLRIPRKTFRAHAEAEDVSTAMDRVRDKLERQLRDHHRKRRPVHDKGALGYAPAADAEAGAVPEAELGDTGRSTGRSAG